MPIRTMAKRLLISVLLICSLVLSACGVNLKAGTVVGKTYQPAHKTYAPYPVRIGKVTHLFPKWISHPEKWYITVSEGDEKDTWEVDRALFGSVAVGDYIKRPGMAE